MPQLEKKISGKKFVPFEDTDVNEEEIEARTRMSQIKILLVNNAMLKLNH